jgi:hypothetical protein
MFSTSGPLLFESAATLQQGLSCMALKSMHGFTAEPTVR